MMYSNIGIDLVKISRFQGYSIEDPFLLKIFTKNELEYSFKKKVHENTLSGKFAAKEAVIKILNNFTHLPYSMKSIEILNNKNGSPYLNKCPVEGYTSSISLSISHDGDYAIAIALLDK